MRTYSKAKYSIESYEVSSGQKTKERANLPILFRLKSTFGFLTSKIFICLFSCQMGYFVYFC